MKGKEILSKRNVKIAILSSQGMGRWQNWLAELAGRHAGVLRVGGMLGCIGVGGMLGCGLERTLGSML